MHMYVRLLRKEMRKLYAIRIKSGETKKYEKEKNMKHKTVHTACSREAESHKGYLETWDLFCVCEECIHSADFPEKFILHYTSTLCNLLLHVEERYMFFSEFVTHLF